MAPPAETDPLFVKNRRYLERAFPEVAAAVAGCRLEAERLLAVGDDDWDLVRRDGARLYGKGAGEFARAQEEAFWADVEHSRMSLPPPANIAVDRLANGFVTDCLRGAVDAGVRFFEQRCDNSAATVIVYGIGLGPHLTALVNRSECESIILIEPEADLFFHSLFVFDWQAFVETVRRRGGDVGLMVGWDPGATAYTVMSWLNNRYPSLIDGTLFYTHYESDVLAAIDRDFRMKYEIQVAVGLGFVEDELFMLNNSVRNLEAFEGPMFRRGAPPAGLPAFIVGSGPSVDQSIDRIKEFSDRAVVFSCGTGLEVLLRNGVVPDLHAALEACSQHLISHGGHAAAAGLRIEERQLDDFRAEFCEYAAREITGAQRTAELRIDAEAPLSAFTMEAVGQMEQLAPFGKGNDRPLLCTSGVNLTEPPRAIGSGGRHLAMRLVQHGVAFRTVAFGGGQWADELTATEEPLDVAFRPVVNTFRGRRTVELHLVDWKRSEQA